MSFFRKAKYFSDREIIAGLQSGGDREDEIIAYLYKTHFAMMVKMIRSRGGTEEEAKDIFQEAIIDFYENIKKGRYQELAKISTYLYSLCKNKWINYYKRQSKTLGMDKMPHQTEENLAFDGTESVAKSEFVKELMSKLGEDCRHILVLSIFKGYSMKDIVKEKGYKNEQVARNKKSKCLKYLKQILLDSTSMLRKLKDL